MDQAAVIASSGSVASRCESRDIVNEEGSPALTSSCNMPEQSRARSAADRLAIKLEGGEIGKVGIPVPPMYTFSPHRFTLAGAQPWQSNLQEPSGLRGSFSRASQGLTALSNCILRSKFIWWVSVALHIYLTVYIEKPIDLQFRVEVAVCQAVMQDFSCSPQGIGQ
jgi:hypothetical protein